MAIKNLEDLFAEAGMYGNIDSEESDVLRDPVVADFYKSYVAPKLAAAAFADSERAMEKLAKKKLEEEAIEKAMQFKKEQVDLAARAAELKAEIADKVEKVKSELQSLLRECEKTNNEKACYKIELAISSIDGDTFELGDENDEEE